MLITIIIQNNRILENNIKQASHSLESHHMNDRKSMTCKQ